MKPVLIVTVTLALALAGLAQESKPAQPLRSSLEGTVVNAQGGEPIKKATVQAIAEGGTQGEAVVYTAVTDSGGQFKVDLMNPGRYRVFVERTGFIDIDQHRHRSDGVELTIEPGKPMKDFVLRVIPAAAVTGRVLDEDGDPMPGVAVSVFHLGYTSCHWQLEPQGSERTNDLGEYRIGGLAPEKYFVSASPPPTYASMLATQTRDTERAKPQLSYATTYYPGVTDPGQAAAIELRAGETVPVDFSLVRVPSFRVNGTVAEMASLAIPGSSMTGAVALRPKTPENLVRQSEINRSGRFEFADIPPGRYTVWVLASDGRVSSIPQTVDVASDINNIHLVAMPAAKIVGRLHVEGARNVDLPSLRVDLRPLDRDSYMDLLGPDWGNVNRDGSFELQHVAPGRYEVSLEGNPGHNTVFLKRVLSSGTDVSMSGIQVLGNALTLEVIAAPATAEIEGSVTDPDAQPAVNATVVAVPSAAYRGVQEHYRTALTDQHGRFQLQGLRPDDYTILAWEDVENGAWCDPDFLKRYESSGERVHLPEGGQQTVTVKLIPANTQAK